VHDGQALAIWQLFEQLAQVALCLSGFQFRRGEQFEIVVERIVQRLMSRAGAQVIRQLVARDCVNPCGQWLVRAISLPSVVHGQQHFLNEIFYIAGLLLEPPFEKAAEMRAQFAEEFPIGGFVAGHAG
jgi:hypothetical protein